MQRFSVFLEKQKQKEKQSKASRNRHRRVLKTKTTKKTVLSYFFISQAQLNEFVDYVLNDLQTTMPHYKTWFSVVLGLDSNGYSFAFGRDYRGFHSCTRSIACENHAETSENKRTPTRARARSPAPAREPAPAAARRRWQENGPQYNERPHYGAFVANEASIVRVWQTDQTSLLVTQESLSGRLAKPRKWHCQGSPQAGPEHRSS